MRSGERIRPKTWSLLGDVKRRPTPYEAVTAKFHYHFRRQPAPFELDTQSPINQWYLRYREGSPFQVEDWEGFRDPQRLTYKDYVSRQHDREVHTDLLIDEHESAESLAGLSSAWVATLRQLVVPLRFPLHVLQMTGSYVAQMAPSSFITNCANFQAADEMRRIQRLAYWTKALSLTHGEDLASTESARSAWEQEPAWQPLRRALEELLVARDWGEAFVALNLAMKPTADALVNGQLVTLARRNGDDLLGALCMEFRHDSERSREWSAALVQYAVAQRPELKETVQEWLGAWLPKAHEAATGLTSLFESAPNPLPADELLTAAGDELRAFHEACGL